MDINIPICIQTPHYIYIYEPTSKQSPTVCNAEMPCRKMIVRRLCYAIFSVDLAKSKPRSNL